MVKHRLYDSSIKPKGSFYNLNGIIGLQLKRDTKIWERFMKHINIFLEDEGLKIVSNESSHIRHNKLKDKNIHTNFYDVYYRYTNPRTQKMELKLIGSSKTSSKSEDKQ